MLRQRLRESIADATKTIGSGRLTGADLVSAYATRAVTHANLGQIDQAFRDLNAALKLAPNATDALVKRADIQFQLGRFDKAVADLSRAIALGETDPRVFQLRGMAHYFAGRLEAALADFARGSDTIDRDSQLYNDIWSVIAHRRLRRPVPEALVRRARAEPRGDWPRPALAMLAGQLPPDDMLAAVEEKKGDDRHLARAEATFFLAQDALLRGDKGKARALFTQTREMDVFVYYEHMAAGFELQRLGKMR
jgi:lipoprotein NlpI